MNSFLPVAQTRKPENQGDSEPVEHENVRLKSHRGNWHGSNAGHSSGVAGVDARRATPPDPRLARWGLAGGRQLDPSHPALVTREDPGVEPCLIPCGPSLSLSRLLAWPVLRCPLLERPGIGSAWHASHATKCYVFPAFSKIWKSGFRRKLLMNRWLWLFGSRRSFRR